MLLLHLTAKQIVSQRRLKTCPTHIVNTGSGSLGAQIAFPVRQPLFSSKGGFSNHQSFLVFEGNSEEDTNNSVGDGLEEERTWAALTEGMPFHTLPWAWLPLYPEVAKHSCLLSIHLSI